MKESPLLHELAARLPELEWKINSLGLELSTNSLPRGLFQSRLDMNATVCIAEIKTDLQRLADKKNELSAYYLAEKIRQKISVLVTLCHLQASKPKPERKLGFGLEKLSTRQQWIHTLEEEIDHLTIQRDALANSLAQLKMRGSAQALLKLQSELGEVEKKLTQIKETLTARL